MRSGAAPPEQRLRWCCAGGVIVCAENFLLYRAEGHPEVRAVIPRRTSLSGERGVLITAACQMKIKTGFFIFVQASCAGPCGGAGVL